MATFFRANPTFSAEALAAPKAATITASAATPAITGSAPSAVTAVSAASAPSAASTVPAAAGLGRTAVSAASVGAFTQLSPGSFTQPIVEVGEALPPPIIFRGGKEVLAPAFNPKAVDDFLVHTVPIGHTKVPVAVSQSIPAGTRVAKGTPVDIVLATVGDIPFPLFDHFHADLANKTVADLLPIATNPAISLLLDKDETTLTTSDKTTITTALAAQNVQVVDTDATRNFATALQSLRSARAFA